jgi:hypothetical protein
VTFRHPNLIALRDPFLEKREPEYHDAHEASLADIGRSLTGTWQPATRDSSGA